MHDTLICSSMTVLQPQIGKSVLRFLQLMLSMRLVESFMFEGERNARHAGSAFS